MADIDEIRSGRRRDWWGRREQQRKDKLSRSPLDQMKKLIRESNSPTEVPAAVQQTTGVLKEFLAGNTDSRSEPAGAAGPDNPPNGASAESRPARLPKRGTHEWGLHMERQRYLHEWQQTRRQLLFWAIVAGAALVLIGGGYSLYYMLYGSRERAEMREFMKRSSLGESFFDLSTPIRALGTYRGAWIRGDMLMIWEMTVQQSQKDVLAVRSLDRHILEQNSLYKAGSFGDWVNVIRETNQPEYYQHPSFSSRDGELAVFRSPPHVPKGQRVLPIRYMIAFAYQKGKWKFVQSCPEKAWRPQWTSLYQVKPAGFQQKAMQ